jgi:hypothetical protein
VAPDTGKPPCDWGDADARVAAVDRLATDGLALLGVLEGRQLSAKVAEAAELVALVIGQDLEADHDGTWRIARRVARDRIISTVDPARHGQETSSRKFDGCKGHVAVDPDSEIINDTTVGPANSGDADMTSRLTRGLDTPRRQRRRRRRHQRRRRGRSGCVGLWRRGLRLRRQPRRPRRAWHHDDGQGPAARAPRWDVQPRTTSPSASTPTR